MLEAKDLLSLVRVSITHLGTNVSVSKGLIEIEGQLSSIVEKIPPRLSWLRDRHSDDPILLEDYKAYALEVELKIKRVAPMIRDIRYDNLDMKTDVKASNLTPN